MAKSQVWYNQNAEIVELTPEAEQMLCVDKGALLGKRYYGAGQFMVTEKGAGNGHSLASMVIANGEAVCDQFIGVLLPGRGYRWLLSDCQALPEDDPISPGGAVESLRDISPAVNNIQNIRRGKVLDSLCQGIVHEIRNPINVMSVTTALLREKKNHADIENVSIDTELARIERQVQRLAEMMDSLCTLRRRKNVDPDSSSSLSDACFQAIKSWNQNHIKKGKTVRLLPSEEQSEITIQLAKQDVVLILTEALALLMLRNPGTMEATLACFVEDLDHACVQIVTRGSVPASLDTQDLFDPYSSLLEGEDGFGLCKANRILSEVGGAMNIYNREGEGCCVADIHLPLQQNPNKGSVE